MLRVLHQRQEVSAFSDALRREGKRLALVPTMGFLHEGHLSLMREGAKRADVTAVSIFVNPTQFGPQEDLSRYPRDLKGDLAKCESAQVSVVYVPEPQTVYPPGYQTFVEVTDVSQGLCGVKRPGHFRGVATVVTKLLALFRPQVALFGEKDFQQLKVIEQLNRDLELGVEIVGMPIVRESDGLAMSSRNAYLKPAERQQALALSRALNVAQAMVQRGEGDVELITGMIRRELEAAKVREDYVEIVDPMTLRPIARIEPGVASRVLVAGFVGPTRLIDNMSL